MKVILIANVQKMGIVGDVVNVSAGYARNYLIPQAQAINYSEENYKSFQEKKAQFEANNLVRAKDAQKVHDDISKHSITMIENASDEGRLYGSISTATIANKINELLGQSIVKRAQIVIKKPIKEVGIHYVTVNLHPEVVFDVQVITARSEEETKALLNRDKEVEIKEEKKEAEKEEVRAK